MVNWFNELSAVDVSSKVKQKQGKNYLSWMWAWSELMKRYPLSYATVHETEDGSIVWKDPVGGHVKTTVTIVWEDDGELKEHSVTEYLPIMSLKNTAIPYDQIDSMAVNKTVQRSLTKCIARLGLGGFVFAGEDLPEEVKETEKIVAECYELIKKKCALSEETKAKVTDLCKTELPEDCNGDPKLCEDLEVLKTLKRKLMAIRKVAAKTEK